MEQQTAEKKPRRGKFSDEKRPSGRRLSALHPEDAYVVDRIVEQGRDERPWHSGLFD